MVIGRVTYKEMNSLRQPAQELTHGLGLGLWTFHYTQLPPTTHRENGLTSAKWSCRRSVWKHFRKRLKGTGEQEAGGGGWAVCRAAPGGQQFKAQQSILDV